jgi:hypothetical protein
MPNESQAARWPGLALFDADGAKVGKIEDVFADERTGRPAWATVSSGLLGRRHHFVPIDRAREVEDGVTVPLAGQLVKDAPRVDEDGSLSLDDERALYRHYGMDHDDAGSTDADPEVAGAGAGRRADEHGQDHDHRARDAGDRDDDRHDQDPAARDDDRGRRPDRGSDPDRRDEDHTGEATDADALGTHGATRADGVDGDPRGAAGDEERDRGPVAAGYGHRDERTHRDDDEPGDDVTPAADAEGASGAGEPPPRERQLQADATTAARERAERERLASVEAEAEAERERRVRERAAAPTAEPAVLDRELAQEDLSVAPSTRRSGAEDRVPDAGDVLPQHDATGDPDPVPGDHLTGATDHTAPVPDARFVGRPHVDDDHHAQRDRVIDPGAGTDAPGGADQRRPTAGSAADEDARREDPERPAGGSSAASSPGAGTRLRRMVRNLTSTKDDHHG